MIKFPNKVYSYKESTLYYLVVLLKIMQIHSSIPVLNLYQMAKIKNIDDFLSALTLLFALKKIKLNNNKIVLV